MICPINPDRFTEMCQAERRLKFLEALAKSHSGHLHIACEYHGLTDIVDRMMLDNPELCEQITEVVAK